MTTATAGSPWTCRLELLLLQKWGGVGLLSIMTTDAKLLHPSHLLPAVQLISRSQEFLSGPEQHPKASRPIAIVRAAKHYSDASNIPFLLPSQPPVSGFLGCKLMLFHSCQPSLWKLERLLFSYQHFALGQYHKATTKQKQKSILSVGYCS